MANQNELSFQITNISNLIDFLKKMSVVEQNLLLEIDVNDRVIAKTFDRDRTVVKKIECDFSSIFEYTGDEIKQRVHIGIYNLPKFINVLGFLPDQTTFTLLKNEAKQTKKKVEVSEYLEIDKILLKSSKINFDIDCAAKNLFVYLGDEKFVEITDIDNKKISFDFDLEERKNIFNLMNSDDSSEILTISYQNNNVLFSGKGWKYKADFKEIENENTENFSIMVKKKNIRSLDNLEYTAYLMDQHLVFKTKESDNIILVGAVLEDID
jgi:hypothetical protein